jgi:hypothetical protein
MTPQEVDCTTGASENVTVSFSIQFHQVKPWSAPALDCRVSSKAAHWLHTSTNTNVDNILFTKRSNLF